MTGNPNVWERILLCLEKLENTRVTYAHKMANMHIERIVCTFPKYNVRVKSVNRVCIQKMYIPLFYYNVVLTVANKEIES